MISSNGFVYETENSEVVNVFSRLIVAAIVGFFALLLIGMAIPAIINVRTMEDRQRCLQHLQSIWKALQMAEGKDIQSKKPIANYPAASIVNPKLNLEDRLSWFVDISPFLGQLTQSTPRQEQFEQLYRGIDRSAKWSDPRHAEMVKFRLNHLVCPSGVNFADPLEFATTEYVANGGIGLETPEKTVDDAGKLAGAFRHSQATPLSTIQAGDGASHSIAILETRDRLGPWMQAGIPTLRAIEPDQQPFKLPLPLFGGFHAEACNVLFADGSGKSIGTRIEPSVFRALLTIQGDEKTADD
jgi:prepilin-type processing-associated H-X9-DG protein